MVSVPTPAPTAAPAPASAPPAADPEGTKQVPADVRLPDWMRWMNSGAFEIDPDKAYPAILGALGVDPDRDADQYWIEVAYQCAKLKAQDAIFGSSIDPTQADPPRPLVLFIKGGDEGIKQRWALASFDKGKGAEAASQGREARDHYQRIRNRIG
jgi:hypothetical protein